MEQNWLIKVCKKSLVLSSVPVHHNTNCVGDRRWQSGSCWAELESRSKEGEWSWEYVEEQKEKYENGRLVESKIN